MKPQNKGFSLDGLSEYWELITPAERSRFRQNQVALTGIRAGERVLDVGCGTGALSILAKISTW